MHRNKVGLRWSIAGIAGGIALALFWPDKAEAPEPAPLVNIPEKPGVQYLIIKSGDTVPTQHLTPPMELHIHGVTLEECLKMGGSFQAASTVCLDVDY